VQPKTAAPLGKERVCSFSGDPHLTSFLGTQFDLHLEGVYTLLEYGEDVKIQMLIKNCGGNPSWLAGGLKVSCARQLAVQLQANTRALVVDHKTGGWVWCTEGACASRPYPAPLYKMCDESNRACVEGKRTLTGTDVTIDTVQFKVSVNASTSSLFGGIKLKAESSWFLSAPGACGGGPTSTNQLAPIGSRETGDLNAAQKTTQLFPCRRCIRGGARWAGFCQCNEFLVAPAAQLTSVAITNDARNTDSFIMPKTVYGSDGVDVMNNKVCLDALRAHPAGALALSVSALKEETEAIVAGCVADRIAGMDVTPRVQVDQLCMVAYLEGQRGNPDPNLCKLQRQCPPALQSSICDLRPNLDRSFVQPCASIKDKKQCCLSSERANSQNACIAGDYAGGAKCAAVEWLTAQSFSVQQAADSCEGATPLPAIARNY